MAYKIKSILLILLIFSFVVTAVACHKDPQPQMEETQTETTAEAAAETKAEEKVWVAVSGSKYHRHSGCSGMKEPREVAKDDAVKIGYEPCKWCYGEI